jgi:hypothetical protein
MENCEEKISRQSLKKIPGEWRGEILAAAHNSQTSRHTSPITRHSWLSTLNHQLSTLLWPHPKAWAGLAAVWIFIFALNFSMRDTSPRIAKQSVPPSPEVIVELKKQQRMFAELIGSRETPDADRQKIFRPKPRSERVGIWVT